MIKFTSMLGSIDLTARDFKTLLDAVEEERLMLVYAGRPIPEALTAKKEYLLQWLHKAIKCQIK